MDTPNHLLMCAIAEMFEAMQPTLAISVRRKESETERELRIAREEIERLKVERRVLVDALNGRTA